MQQRPTALSGGEGTSPVLPGYAPPVAQWEAAWEVYRLGGLVSSPFMAYHGYKRNNDSVGWGIGWWLLGGSLWPVTVTTALVQGFARPLPKANRRKRTSRKCR